MRLTVYNQTRGKEVANRVRVASSFISRAIGLLGTSSLAPGEGLYLKPCQSVHTFFMQYPIDVLFVDSSHKVLQQLTLKPWRMSGWMKRTEAVVELAAGTLDHTGTRVGDQLALKENL